MDVQKTNELPGKGFFNSLATDFVFPLSLSKIIVMKRIFLLSLIVTVYSVTAFSQAHEGSIDYDKKTQAAFIIEYPYPVEATENALKKKMDEMGYKGREEKGLFNKDKGFIVFKGISIADISANNMDYAFKIESKGKKENAQSVIYLVILDKDGANAKTLFAAADAEKAKSFLNNLQPAMEAAGLELQIKNQEDLVAKAEKKLSNLKDDKSNMEKKIQKLQDDIKDNEKDQDNQQKQVDAQRQALDALKGKRKTN